MYPNFVRIGDTILNANYLIAAERLNTRRPRITMLGGRTITIRLDAGTGEALARALERLGLEDWTPPAAPPPIDDCRTCRLAERIAGALRGPRTDNR